MSFIETLVILVVAIIVFGPKKMPEVARKLGRWMGMLRQARDNFQRQLMEMDQQVNNTLNSATDELDHLLPSDEDLETPAKPQRPLTPRDFTEDAPDEFPPPYFPPSAPPARSPDDAWDTAPVPGGLPPEPEAPKAEPEASPAVKEREVPIVAGPYPSMAPGKTPRPVPMERRVMKVREEPPPAPRSLGLSPTKPEEKHG